MGILDLGIEVIGSNADELGAEIGEKHLIVTVGRFRRADRIVILHPTLYLERSAFLRASEFAQRLFVAAIIDTTCSKTIEQPLQPLQLEVTRVTRLALAPGGWTPLELHQNSRHATRPLEVS